MKSILTLLIGVFFNIGCFSQQLDQSISEIATDLAQKVSKKNKVKLALTDFVNSDGKVDALTIYIRDELELKLINADNLQVIDRKHINLLLSEHHLQSNGLIDESVAKSAISFIKVDGWVIAEITMVDEQIKLKVTVTDVSTSLMYAASTTAFFSDATIKKLLDSEIKVCAECGGSGSVQVQTICSSCDGKGSNTCSNCQGVGSRVSLGASFRCDPCNGTGRIDCKACLGYGKILSYQTCQKCNGKVVPLNFQKKPFKSILCDECIGTGKIKIRTSCVKCRGSGRRQIQSDVPFIAGPCDFCSGVGAIISFNKCSKCDGSGKL